MKGQSLMKVTSKFFVDRHFTRSHFLFNMRSEPDPGSEIRKKLDPIRDPRSERKSWIRTSLVRTFRVFLNNLNLVVNLRMRRNKKDGGSLVSCCHHPLLKESTKCKIMGHIFVLFTRRRLKDFGLVFANRVRILFRLVFSQQSLFISAGFEPKFSARAEFEPSLARLDSSFSSRAKLGLLHKIWVEPKFLVRVEFEPTLARLELEFFRAEPNSNPALFKKFRYLLNLCALRLQPLLSHP